MSELKTKPKATTSLAEKELDSAERQFEKFDKEIKDLTLDRMNMAPKEEVETQTKIANSDIDKMKEIYLKPIKTIACRDKFNENYRKQYEFEKEYVHFYAENKEIIGETIDLWTRPYAGMPAEEWKVPCNTPLWAPRYVAEQIKRKFYHVLVMEQKITGSDREGQYYGSMVVDKTKQRLDAIPVSKNRSVFMGANAF